MTLRIGSLCTGYGGLTLATEEVTGGETVWVSDIDKGARKVLDWWFPGVPNLGDMTQVDWTQVPPVDVLDGGTPCQDLSHAGKRAGMTEGSRSNLWVSMREAIAALRPQLVIWENVAGAYSAAADSELEPDAGLLGDAPRRPALRALGRVLGDLATLRYDAEWHGIRASDVGAPHGRLRVFLVAYPIGSGRDGWPPVQVGGPLQRTPAVGSPETALLPTPAVNDMGAGKTPAEWDVWTDRMKHEHDNGNGHGKSLAIELQRVEPAWGPYAAAVERWERVTGRPAPSPNDGARVREWMMGLPDGWITDVPGITKNEAVKLAGNGVVWQQATAALRTMLTRAMS